MATAVRDDRRPFAGPDPLPAKRKPFTPAVPASWRAGAQPARGAAIWDERGRQSIDFCGAFGQVVLGHADPAVDAAAMAQWDQGNAERPKLEAALTARLRSVMPFAEACRFTDDPVDALAWAVSAARIATGHATVLVCNPGPVDEAFGDGSPRRFAAAATGDYASFADGDLAAVAQLLERHGGAAAVVLSPLLKTQPCPAYLGGLRKLADQYGSVLIFDEVQTGFRIDIGGAYALTGITPDLAVFGASLANGFPLAAIVGRKGVIAGGGGLTAASSVSLAAACAVFDKLDNEPVLTTLTMRGAEIQAEVETLLAQTGAGAFTTICGDPTYSYLVFSPYKGVSGAGLKRRFREETLNRGVFTLGAHVMSYAHGDDDIYALLDTYGEVFPLLTAMCQTDRSPVLATATRNSGVPA
ncbi:MAG: aminotransferase class III-fold pyridoxal phosphate-dependent enzyme [Caulobacteraceae bacterium]